MKKALRSIRSMSIFIFFMVLITGTVSAQEAPFRAEVAKDSIRGDEVCQVRFIIENMQGAFEPPEFEDFELMGSPHRSSFFRSVNGETTRLQTFTFYLRPKKTGLLLIPPAQFKSDEATWNTRALDVWVQPGTLPADPPGEKDNDQKTKRI